MSRAATTDVIPGVAGLSVGLPGREAPPGWRWMRLTDVARLESGHTPSRRHPEYWNGDVPWLTLPDARVHHGKVITETSQTINEAGLANSAARLLPAGTVCLSRTASVGNVTRLGRPMATSQDFVNWVCSPALDPRFLMYAILAEGDHLLEFGKGTTHTTIYFPEVLAFHICMPERAEQERIVEKVEGLLGQVNAARERLTRVREILLRFRQSVLAAACSGRLTEEWRDAHSEQSGRALLAVLLTDRPKRLAEDQCERTSGRSNKYRPPEEPFEGDSLPDVPDGWVWTSLDALTFKIVDGVHRTPCYVEAGVPFVTVRNLTAGSGIDLAHLNHVTRKDHLQFIDRANPVRGDLLISKDGTLGVVRAVRTDDEFSIFVSVALAKPVTTDLTDFLELVLTAPQIQQRMVPTGSGLQHLHLRDLKTVPVPLPPLAEQREIVRRVEALFAVADATENRLAPAMARCERLPQATLAQAFRGGLVATAGGS